MNYLFPPTVSPGRIAGGAMPDPALTDNLRHDLAATVTADAAGQRA